MLDECWAVAGIDIEHHEYGDHKYPGVLVEWGLYGSKSPQRKMASAMIAKIPLPLSTHVARSFKP